MVSVGMLDGDSEVWCKQLCLVNLDHLRLLVMSLVSCIGMKPWWELWMVTVVTLVILRYGANSYA